MDENAEVAIQEDVTEEVSENRQPSPRELAMEAISAKHVASVEEELGIKHDEAPDEIASQVDEQLAEPVESQEVQRFKVKIDGIEQEVDADTLVRTYQKNAAADRRLEEATRLLREAEERAQQAVTQAQPEDMKTPDELRNDAVALLDKMYEGDSATAAEALVNLIARAKGGDQPTPTVQVDENRLAARVLETMAVNTAFEKIKSDYPDLIADPDLEFLTATKIDRAVAAGMPRSVAMIDAAEEVYKSLGRVPVGRQQQSQKPANSLRQDNKARLDNIPTASASAVPPASPMESASPSSVIAELANKRLGQSIGR